MAGPVGTTSRCGDTGILPEPTSKRQDLTRIERRLRGLRGFVPRASIPPTTSLDLLFPLFNVLGTHELPEAVHQRIRSLR